METQEAELGRSPREGAELPPTDLGRLVQELQKEGAIVPSRHLRRLVREEAWRRREVSPPALGAPGGHAPGRRPPECGAGGVGAPPGARPPEGVRPALLSRLVDEVLAYCRALLPAAAAPERASGLPRVAAAKAGGGCGVGAGGAEGQAAHQAELLGRCAETYSQLLLANSDVSFRRVLVRHLLDGREVALSVRTDATMWEVKEALARWLGRPEMLTSAQLVMRGVDGSVLPFRDAEGLGAKRCLLVRDADLLPEKGSPAHHKAQREAALELREAKLSGSAAQLRLAIDRAVQVGLDGNHRALAAGMADGGEVELARKCLEELEAREAREASEAAPGPAGSAGRHGAAEARGASAGQLHEAPRAGAGAEPGSPGAPGAPGSPGAPGAPAAPGSPRRGGRTVHPTPFFEAVYAILIRAVQQELRAFGGQERGGAARLAARVEEELGQLFRSREFGRSAGRGLRRGGAKVASTGRVEEESAKSAARAEEELGKLMRTFSQNTASINQKFERLESLFKNAEESKDQSREEGAEKLAPAAESKDSALADVDLAAYTASVDALIAGFKARALPRRRPAEQAVAMQHVGLARSPIMASLLPSPAERARALGRGAREPPAPRAAPPAAATAPPALANAWALSRGRPRGRPGAQTARAPA